MDVLEHLLQAPATLSSVVDLTTWFERLAHCPFVDSIDRALWAGFEADRLGYAFVGGYQAALARLLGDTSFTTRRSLAATESGGAHPRAVETKLVDENGAHVLRGAKTFATLASAADELLVVASRGAGDDGKNRLVLVRVAATAPGITIVDRALTPFAPEIPHARVTLDGVRIDSDDVLPDDGYDAYLKPFRTIEDMHVLAATLGNIVRTARACAFDTTVTERAIATAAALRAIAARAPSDPVAHVTLAGLFDTTRELVEARAVEWKTKAPADVAERWQRDLPLMMVAETARQARTASAWRALATA